MGVTVTYGTTYRRDSAGNWTQIGPVASNTWTATANATQWYTGYRQMVRGADIGEEIREGEIIPVEIPVPEEKPEPVPEETEVPA